MGIHNEKERHQLYTHPKDLLSDRYREYYMYKKTMLECARELLGQGTDPANDDNRKEQGLSQFVSTQEIHNSIKSSKVNKAPGVDGLPIEFYDALAKSPSSTTNSFLQKLYIQAYKTGVLHPSKRKSQISGEW